MSFADVEYDWALTHEDLRIPEMRASRPLTPDKFGGPDMARPCSASSRAFRTVSASPASRRAPSPMSPRQARPNWAIKPARASASP